MANVNSGRYHSCTQTFVKGEEYGGQTELPRAVERDRGRRMPWSCAAVVLGANDEGRSALADPQDRGAARAGALSRVRETDVRARLLQTGEAQRRVRKEHEMHGVG